MLLNVLLNVVGLERNVVLGGERIFCSVLFVFGVNFSGLFFECWMIVIGRWKVFLILVCVCSMFIMLFIMMLSICCMFGGRGEVLDGLVIVGVGVVGVGVVVNGVVVGGVKVGVGVGVGVGDCGVKLFMVRF